MRLSSFVIALSPLFPTGDLLAQAIPRTVAAAEAEVGHLGRAENTAAQTSVLRRPSSGTSERRCIAPPVSDDSLAGGALRSGDFVVRTRFTGPFGFRAGKGQKVLWLPLHPSADPHIALLIRAARPRVPADTLRQVIPRSVRSHGEIGYPSAVDFPSAGEWLVVATAGADWGCFLIHVDD